jgi:signal transduction histidine kinase
MFMKIRDRLSLQFTIISAILLFGVLTGIYILTAEHSNNDFHDRLLDRAITNDELFLAQDNLSEEKFRDVQRKFPQSLPEEIVRIYNDSNQSVFIKDNSYQWPKSVIAQVRKQKLIYYASDKRQTAGIYYIDNSGNFTVLVSAVDTYGLRQMQQLFWVMFFAFFISVFILFFAGRLFARIALFPMIKVINDVKFIRSTSLDKRLRTKEGKDEINELAITFNNLLEHLEQSFETQRSFVAHASHELRTPVTSIIGEVEVTLSQERGKEEYKRALEGVMTESGKLNDLINNLFDLAQANIDITEFQNVRLDELLWQVKDEWSSRIPESEVVLSYNLPEDPNRYTIQGNSHLLFIAVGNILKNAIKFSNNKIVTCKLYLQNNSPVISILDIGIGINKEDIQNIFRPFFRGANTFGYAGYGVGLSLADKIFRLHNAHISIHSELNIGTEFLIYFTS